jgi:hypothetical protein
LDEDLQEIKDYAGLLPMSLPHCGYIIFLASCVAGPSSLPSAKLKNLIVSSC